MLRPSVESMINQTTGPFLEVGGPSQHFSSAPSIDFGKIEKPLIVSNVGPDYVLEGRWRNPILGSIYSTEPPTGWRRKAYRFVGADYAQDEYWNPIEHKLDLIEDATALRFATGSLGALYGKGLQPEVELAFVTREAPRTLEIGGVLVLDRAAPERAEDIPLYFDPIKIKKAGNRAFNLALRRNDLPYQDTRANARA